MSATLPPPAAVRTAPPADPGPPAETPAEAMAARADTYTAAELDRFHRWATNVIELQFERRLPLTPLAELWRSWRYPPKMPPIKRVPLDVEPLPDGKTWGDILDESGFTARLEERAAEAEADATKSACPCCDRDRPADPAPVAEGGYDPMPGFGRPAGGEG